MCILVDVDDRNLHPLSENSLYDFNHSLPGMAIVERWIMASVGRHFISAECHTSHMMRCINIALLCVQENAVDRPTMSEVVAMLSSDTVALFEPKHPAYFHVRVGVEEASSSVVESSDVNDVTISALHGR